MTTKIHRFDGEAAPQIDRATPAPGRSTLTSRLVARARTETPGGSRDGNGVAAGADTAVDRAATSSTGAPLPDDVRVRFEASTGADLSAVRVHTGADSADAAQVIGARAFATGNDIHFAAGQYAPLDPFGLHLLAHEVAHTVQQQGGAPTTQYKLEVSSPDDDAEVEADRAADAMVAGAACSIGNGGVRAARQVFRKSDWGAGGKVTPVADGLVKLQGEVSGKYEHELTYVSVAGQLSGGFEAEVKWNPDANSGGISGKSTGGKDGKQTQQYEMEIPMWKAEAKKAAQEEADKSWKEMFAPVEASLVFGVEGSEKPGHEALNRTLAEQKNAKPGEAKGAVAVGLKCKTKSGDTYTVKLQLFELAKKDGKVLDVSGPALKANYDKKIKFGPRDVKMGELPAALTGTVNLKPELTFKPNWTQIAEDVARKGADQIATEVITGAIDIAATAGPPLFVAAIIAHSIYIAGEKGKRDADLLAGAMDASQAAMDFAQIMCGNDVASGAGAISRTAQQRAHAELAGIAARNHVTVEQLMTELRARTTPADFARVHNQMVMQGKNAYRGKVADTIAAWRAEHNIAALLTRQEDDVNAAWKMIETVWH